MAQVLKRAGPGSPFVDALAYDQALPPSKKERKQHKGRGGTNHLRKRVYARDGHRCVLCGTTRDLTLDHRIPKAKGGGHGFHNLQTMCEPCNHAKADSLT